MRNTIPNPTKAITVPFSQEEVKKALKSLTKALEINNKKGYLIESFDEFLGELRLTKTEFLSAGIRIIINTNTLNESSTNINIEIQRIVGGFDTFAEVTLANDHINNVSAALSLALKDKLDITDTELENTIEKDKETSLSSALLMFVIGVGVLIAVLLS